MTKEPTFCQFFFNKETKKLAAIKIWLTKTSSSMSTLPTATAKHKTFFNWNLMVDLTSWIFEYKSSWWETGVGNLPALDNCGPNNLGTCLIKTSEAMKALYFLANFLINFLFLFNFFKSSTDMASTPTDLAASTSKASPKIQMDMFGLGT